MYKLHNKLWIKGALFLLVIGLTGTALAQNRTAQSQTIHPEPVATKQKNLLDEKKIFPQSQPQPAQTLKREPQPQVPAPVIKGLALHIDSIGLHIPLGKTGLDKNRRLLVPANANNAAIYAAGPQPGAPGTALITGHYDANGGRAGVFYNLEKVAVGNEIRVNRADGKVATYKVDKLASYKQDNTFPWSSVFSTTGKSGLRIITCDGTFNPKTGKYSHNLVVYASLISVQ